MSETTDRFQSTGLLIALFALALFLSVRLVYLWVADAERFPINTVKISATYQHVTRKQLASVLSEYLQASFFSLSASKLQQALCKIEWVDKVSVERIWPDILSITLVEKKPFAMFGQALVTKEGKLFNQGASVNDNNLPKLMGPEEQKTEVLQVYQKLSKILSGYGLYVASLELRTNQAWEMTLVNGLKIYLGKRDVEPRLSRFCKAYPALIAEKTEHLVSVDLRYPHGMAAKWTQ